MTLRVCVVKCVINNVDLGLTLLQEKCDLQL